MNRLLVCTLLPLAICGCREHQPTLSGGKPPAHWLEAVKDPDVKVRKTAVFKLGNAGPNEPAAFPAVMDALKDPEPVVRCEAVLAILKFGDQARVAEPKLAELHKNDRDAKVRSYAGKALDKLQAAR